MERKPLFIHILVIVTAILAAALVAGGAVYEVSIPSSKTEALLTDGRPRIGRLDAKIELLLIEDFRCGACQYFTQKIFPEIYKKYIETGRAYCVFVPVAFLDGSRPIANAALAVYQLAPNAFLSYLHDTIDFFMQHEVNGEIQKQLLDLAQNIDGIDLNRLQECIETNCFASQLKQNLAWAKRLMGRDFGTPSFFVNGISTSTSSIEAIEELIEKVDKK